MKRCKSGTENTRGRGGVGEKQSTRPGYRIGSSAVNTANSAPSRGFSQPDSPNVGIGSFSRIVAKAYPMVPGATNIEWKRKCT